MATEEQIERLRELSNEVDTLFEAGDEKGGAELMAIALKEAEAVDPAYALFFQGEQARYFEKDYIRQEKLIRRAMESRPQDYYLTRRFGVCLWLQGKKDESDRNNDIALDLNPADYHSWRNKGLALMERGKTKDALKCFERALELNPNSHLVWVSKGTALAKRGKTEDSLKCFERALELNANSHLTWGGKGALLANLGQDQEEEALKCFDKALDLNPKDHESWRNKGVMLSKLGRMEEALECTEKALELAPDDVSSQVNKAWIWFFLGKKDVALALIAKVTKAHPEHQEARAMNEYLLFLIGKAPAPAPTAGTPEQQRLALVNVVAGVRKRFKPVVRGILRSMQVSTKHINDFLKAESQLRNDQALFFILRKWNSYTPCIPREGEERSIGGGYYLLVNGVGTVIDPGYNFLENFHRIGGRITDIHNIVITHAHNDHTADLESILSLVYKFNDDENKKSRELAGVRLKSVRLFLNAGCHRKFSGLLDLRGADYLEDVQTLMPSHEYSMGQGLTLRALPAYHDEVVAKKYAVGLQFELENAGEKPTRVVITSDTGLFPQTKDKKADTSGEEIWKRYALEPGSIHLLVPHIGSIKEEELSAKQNLSGSLHEIFYPNHLGVLGTVRVISALGPELAMVSEFGEELKEFQQKLVEMIAECVQSFQTAEGARTLVLPGDLTFIYELRKREVYCVASKATVRPSSTLEAVLYKEGKQDLFYYRDTNKKSMLNLNELAKHYENSLKDRKLGLVHKKRAISKAT